ncbi:MAG: hypothetical protein HQ553_13360 [Chloroflexi bacterium]|nr:hypothetical protein [Chloroflexota bacterium]
METNKNETLWSVVQGSGVKLLYIFAIAVVVAMFIVGILEFHFFISKD